MQLQAHNDNVIQLFKKPFKPSVDIYDSGHKHSRITKPYLWRGFVQLLCLIQINLDHNVNGSK